jgi:hypothetical protein
MFLRSTQPHRTATIARAEIVCSLWLCCHFSAQQLMQGVFLSEKSASVQKKANIRYTNHVFQAQLYNSKDASSRAGCDSGVLGD